MFVGNLAFKTTEDELQREFEAISAVDMEIEQASGFIKLPTHNYSPT
jgi:RNA recognition motif-containing protein